MYLNPHVADPPGSGDPRQTDILIFLGRRNVVNSKLAPPAI